MSTKHSQEKEKEKEKEKEYKIGKYLIKGTVGRGTFGKVKLGIYLPTHEKVAVKILEKNRIREKDDEIRVQREFEMLTKFNHINLILVAEIFESYDSFYTVMEYCEGGELFNYIVKKRKLSEEEASFFYYQIIKGLEYIHSLGIVHRDLKPENLLLTRNHILKIIDFGLSNYFDNKKDLLVTPCGSPCYASPEMVSGKKYNGFKIDIWSTGIILYAMLCGYLPFEDKDNDLLFKKILECKLELPHHLSLLSKDLIKKILVTNPDKRITIKEIKKHPFFLKGKTLYKQEFSFTRFPMELLIDDDDDISYKPVKTENDDKNNKNCDFNSTIPNQSSKRKENDKKDVKKDVKKDKEENEKKEKEDKIKDKIEIRLKVNSDCQTDNNEKNIKDKNESNKENINTNNIKNNNQTLQNVDPKTHKSLQTSNYINKKIEEIEECEKIIKTEPNTINSFHQLNSKKPSKKKNFSNKQKSKSKSKKPINTTTITHTSYNLSNIGNLETNLNSMRIPLNTLIRKHNLITSKRKPNITIKNTVINVNMFAPNSIITSFTRKSQYRPHSMNQYNHIRINKSERKKPQLKFYDFDSPNSTNYAETIVKTQENYSIKSNRKNEFEHFNFNYKNNNNKEKKKKHNKINSMKLGDIYKNNLKENKKLIYSVPFKSLNTTKNKHSKNATSTSVGKNNLNGKILSKKKNINIKDLFLKDFLKKLKS